MFSDALEQYYERYVLANRSNNIYWQYMGEKWKWYVYILELKNGLYYTGMTWKPSARFDQHLSGLGSKYTAKYGVSRLVYLEEHEDLELARMRELQIKDFSRKKKRRLINDFLSQNSSF